MGPQGDMAGGLYYYFMYGIHYEIFPPLIFLGVGALTDFGPLIAAPLRWHQETIGVLLAAHNAGEAAFSDIDAEWLASLADYVAIAVRNAREFQQRAQQPAPAQPSAAWKQDLEQVAEELQATVEKIRGLAAP